MWHSEGGSVWIELTRSMGEEAKALLVRVGPVDTIDRAIVAAYELGRAERLDEPGPEEVSAAQAATDLGITRTSVYRLIRQGKLQVRRWHHPTDPRLSRTFVTRASLIAVRDDPERAAWRSKLGWEGAP